MDDEIFPIGNCGQGLHPHYHRTHYDARRTSADGSEFEVYVRADEVCRARFAFLYGPPGDVDIDKVWRAREVEQRKRDLEMEKRYG